ncbi:hypothetical protein N7456_000403 [Penicillium angulare]|uniref:Polyketide cyclase/dehydrase n=1 Tax=Penicillium angulare TaxID=116970 RepID=A0A9W9GCD3_9EURO|nr:hypothetical protein N7456_000403 [Penicillium angulare]
MSTQVLSDPSNLNRSTPSIKAEDASLHLGSSIFTSAPTQKVWDALTNTSTWPSWNSFVPHVTITHQPNAENPESLSPILQQGTKMIFHVRMDPTSSKPQKSADTVLVVTEFEAPTEDKPGRIVWAYDSEAAGGYSPRLLVAEREHEIRAVEGGTEIRNWENETGWLIYVVKWMFKAQLEVNFGLWVEGLKKFAEEN